jgi:thiol-disulfide isomerase/thioredoxin
MKRRTLLALAIALLIGPPAGNAIGQSAVKLEGQVVCCAECWAGADRSTVEYGTAEDLLKAKSCVERGDPTLLAVPEGDKYALYQLEPGKFKLPGKNWLEFVGKRASVTGELRKKKDGDVIRVDSFAVTAPSLAERQVASARGQEVDLKLKDLSGVEQRLAALKGRIVILNFWATYCVPCRKEMPDLSKIQNEYAALGVQVIGAAVDEVEDRSEILRFVKDTKINFPVWIGATTADMMRFGLGGALPGTVIISREGRIANVISGIINPLELKKKIDGMLADTATDTTIEPKRERPELASAKNHPNEVSSVPS